MTAWHDVVARVRGLSSRLLGRNELDRLAGSPTLPALVAALSGTSYRGASELAQPTPIALDRETRRIAGDRLGIVATWCGPRVAELAPIFEDEDRRNLRAIARGVAAHAAPEQCVEGLLATPAIPHAALEELARQHAVADIAATLLAWGNPYGRAMLAEASRESPSLFVLQLELDREYARRAVKVAKQVGEPVLSYVHLVIDTENARLALASAAGTVEHAIADLFIEGGRLLPIDVVRAVAAEKAATARSRLAPVVAGTPLAPLAAPSSDDPETAILASLLLQLRHTIRLHPLSLEVVLAYVLALRAELHDLARIIWGVSLQAPRRAIAAGLVTP